MAPDVWEKKLRKMNGGKIWHQLLKNQLPRLRNTTTTLYLRLPDSEVIAVFELSDQLPPLPATAPVPSFPAIGPLASVEIPVLPVKPEWHRYVYIKTKMPDKLNLLTGETSGETDIVYTAAAPPTGEKFPVSGYEYVGMNYLLVSNSDQPTLIDCSFASQALISRRGTSLCDAPLSLSQTEHYIPCSIIPETTYGLFVWYG